MRQAILTVDLGFGDAGKGAIVDFLAREYAAHTVVRYNGGAQAGHRVVTPDPARQEHIFAQFGSGTFAGAATHLSRFMLVDPLAMCAEAAHLNSLGLDSFARTTVDSRARVITPFQRAVNRLKELARGAARHGSCGMGIGETVADALAFGSQTLRIGDLAQPDLLAQKLDFLRQINRAKVEALRDGLPVDEQIADTLSPLIDPTWLDWLLAEYSGFAQQAQIVPGDYLDALLRRPGTVIFEGAQGVLLDEALGFHPHTTWSDATLRHAELLLAEADYRGAVQRIGITRAYATRHGAGPFVTEDAELTQRLPDPANTFGAWQQGFRVGWLDLVLLRYACDVTGRLDALAVTCLDRAAQLPVLKLCSAYCDGAEALHRLAPSPIYGDLAYQGLLTERFGRCRPILRQVRDVTELLAVLETELSLPVAITSWGADAAGKAWRTREPAPQPVPRGATPARSLHEGRDPLPMHGK